MVEPFDPAHATDADLAAYHELVAAVRVADWPGDPVPSYEQTVEGLRAVMTDRGVPSYLVARSGGRVAGSARVGLLDGGNAHIAMVHVQVHPGRRRSGIGTALLRSALPLVRDGERRVILGVPMEGGAGASWAAGLGFRVTQRHVVMRLDLTSADQRLWQPAAAEGYHLMSWRNEAPEDLVVSYARARNAMHDAPSGDDSAVQQHSWTPELVRELERDLASRDVEQWVAVAVHSATGEVAGFTELELYPHMPGIGVQQDTAVLAAHRGHGLGVRIKAAVLRQLAADRPGCQRIDTSTDQANAPMIEVNRRLGFTIHGVPMSVEQDTADLGTRLGL